MFNYLSAKVFIFIFCLSRVDLFAYRMTNMMELWSLIEKNNIQALKQFVLGRLFAIGHPSCYVKADNITFITANSIHVIFIIIMYNLDFCYILEKYLL